MMLKLFNCVLIITVSSCVSHYNKCKVVNKLYSNEEFWTSIFPLELHLTSDECCVIDKISGIERLSYVINKNVTNIQETGIKIAMTQNESISDHYFIDRYNGHIRSEYLRFRSQNNSYELCVKKSQSENINISWDKVTAVATFSLRHIVKDIIDMAVNLRYLSLRSTDSLDVSITTMKELVLYGELPDSVDAPSLEKLFLYETDLLARLPLVFSDVTKESVREVYLRQDNVLWDEICRFSEFTNVSKLDISHTAVDFVYDKENDIRFPSLQELDLSNCKITKVPDAEFSKMFPLLKIINLSLNPILSFDFSILEHLQFLEQVYLVGAFKIHYDIKLKFNNINKIDLLDLSSNNLESIRVKSKMYIRELNVSWNRLTKKNLIVECDRLPCVEKLNISSNHVIINSDFLMNIDNSVIDIGNNTISCTDCDLLKSNALTKILSNQSNVTVLDFGSRDIKCTHPEDKSGKSILFDVNIDEVCPVDHTVVAIGMPLATIGLLLAVMAVIGYKYRFEISYWIEYVRLKRRSSGEKRSRRNIYKYDAFISYCSHDREWVWNELRSVLEKGPEKYKLCLHERDFPLGSYITDNIERSLASSRSCIIILTNYFIQSQWCRWELQMVNYKVMNEDYENLILIELERLEENKIPLSLKHLMNTRTYLEWNLQRYRRNALISRLKKALGESIEMKTFCSSTQV